MRPVAVSILSWLFIIVSFMAQSETLTEALAAAYSNNTDLLAARARLRATDEQVPQALSAWRPTVNLNSSAARQVYNIGTGSLLPTSFSYRQFSYGGTVKLDIPIYQGGRRDADLARAKETVRAARADLLGTEQNVLLEAATAYAGVLRTRLVLEIDREREKVLERRVEETKARTAAGQLTEADVSQAANQLAAARATRIGAEGDVAAAAARYVAAVGHPPPAKLQAPEPPPGLPDSVDAAIGIATANNPTVIASLYRSNAANEAIAVARANLKPNVSFSAQAGADQGQTFPTVPTKGYQATVNLTIPLYQDGGSESRLREAQQNASKAKLDIRTSQRDARKNAESAYFQWQASAAQQVQQREQVRLARIAYEQVRERAALGAVSTYELLGQLDQYYAARAREMDARYNSRVDAYRLLVAVGRFTAIDLRLPVALYDPIAYSREVRGMGGSLLPWARPLDPEEEEKFPSASPPAEHRAVQPGGGTQPYGGK